jgi:hypothetical protein
MVSNSSQRSNASPDPSAVIRLLRTWLQRSVAAEAVQWLDAEIDNFQTRIDERRLPIALGLVRRKIGRKELALDARDVESAGQLRSRWAPRRWSTDEAARVAILLATHQGDDQAFAARVEKLCATAEITELVAILKGLAVLPAPKLLCDRAREGVRSSMQPVFEAIACRNPYPFDYFDEAAWNQMVVKCVFVGAPIDAISGLLERRNPELIRMLVDLIAERRSASRPVAQSVLDYVADHQSRGL